ncbi:YecA family protein [Paraburkholderia sp. J12]|uniref:YecA family protein n=1 Tax=Paraburkholderia sp. J12 TaxID=2805432 RepID=UPI002ABD3B6D|nr:SEC-C metal-binding domain-containing protein [Paraburkholderia sp. J12]
MKLLNSSEGVALLAGMHDVIKAHLVKIDLEVGVDSSAALDGLLDQLKAVREIHASSPDEVLNDIFILETYVTFFRSYGRIWRKISEGRYSESWRALQDASDSLRVIRRLSGFTLTSLVEQLFALESLYPYKIFASCGFVVERFECSICGNDIDSFECNHRKGELYRGQMAYGIAKNILEIDHVALVENPVDKRCVVSIQDNAPGFSGVQYLRDAFNQKHLSVSNFGGVAWGKKLVPNSEYTLPGRNEPCYCRSGKKFKRCCIDKKFREIDHAEILPELSIFERSGLC